MLENRVQKLHQVKKKLIKNLNMSEFTTLINNATQIVAEGYESKENVDELLDRAERLIFEISDALIIILILAA